MENKKNGIKITSINPKIKKIIANGVKLVAAAAITAVLIVSIVSCNAKAKEDQYIYNKGQIGQYYGLNSQEYDILSYLELSELLDRMNVDSLNYTQDTANSLGITNELMAPKDIWCLVDYYKKYDGVKSLSKEDIDGMNMYCSVALSLARQYSQIEASKSTWKKETYDSYVANLKSYIASTYGIKDYRSLILNRHFEKSDGTYFYTFIYVDKRGTEHMKEIVEKDIQKGIDKMISMQKESYSLDRYEYANTISSSIAYESGYTKGK